MAGDYRSHYTRRTTERRGRSDTSEERRARRGPKKQGGACAARSRSRRRAPRRVVQGVVAWLPVPHGAVALSSGVRSASDRRDDGADVRRRLCRRLRPRQSRADGTEPAAQLGERRAGRQDDRRAQSRRAVRPGVRVALRGQLHRMAARRGAARRRAPRRAVRPAHERGDQAALRRADSRAGVAAHRAVPEDAADPHRRDRPRAAREPRVRSRCVELRVDAHQPRARVPRQEPRERAARDRSRAARRAERERVLALLPAAHRFAVRPVREPDADQSRVPTADGRRREHHRHLLQERLQQPVELQSPVPRGEGHVAVALSPLSGAERREPRGVRGRRAARACGEARAPAEVLLSG